MSLMKLKHILNEVNNNDLITLANAMVKTHYKLNSKVKLSNDKNDKGDYDVDKDIIYVVPNKNIKDFMITVLHEINHALQAQKMGKNKYKLAYEKEMNMAVSNDKNPYKDNYFEELAEKWAHSEFKKYWKKTI